MRQKANKTREGECVYEREEEENARFSLWLVTFFFFSGSEMGNNIPACKFVFFPPNL